MEFLPLFSSRAHTGWTVFVGQAFQPAIVGILGQAGWKKLSQNYGPWNLSGRGASRSALIPGGSRTAPTDSGEK